MAKQVEQTPQRGGLLSVILTLGGFALFLIIVALFWLDQNPATVAQGGPSREERLEILREQTANDQEALTQYGWVDRENGIVRLPIDRAIDLVLEDLNRNQN